MIQVKEKKRGRCGPISSSDGRIPSAQYEGYHFCWNIACRLDGIGDAAGLVPFDLALDILDLLQFVA